MSDIQSPFSLFYENVIASSAVIYDLRDEIAVEEESLMEHKAKLSRLIEGVAKGFITIAIEEKTKRLEELRKDLQNKEAKLKALLEKGA